MIKLYMADITNLPEPLSCPELMQTLPPERQLKVHNSKHEKSRKQSMGAGLLLQKVLALYHMETFSVVVGEHGKPMVEGLEFNLSHSGNLVICAVSDQPVGCDVEMIRRAPKGVARRYFSDGEQAYLSRFSGEDYDTAFFRLWTMKESYVKMTGEGLALALGEYELVIDEHDKWLDEGRDKLSVDTCNVTCKTCACGWHEDCAQVLRNGETQACCLSSVELNGHIISICAKSSAHVEVIWENL